LKNKGLNMERICLRCGHQACEDCGFWCDVVLNDKFGGGMALKEEVMEGDKIVLDFVLCCDGNCVYTKEELENDKREFIRV